MRVQVLSFGHKYGTPGDLELLFDVRHLPNPHFVPDLKRLSGHDSRVVKYLNSHAEVKETLSRFTTAYLPPSALQTRRKVLCDSRYWLHGGRHRSVMIANALTRALRRAGLTRMWPIAT